MLAAFGLNNLHSIIEAVKDLGIGQALLVIIIIAFLFFLFRHTKNVYDKLIDAKNEEIKRIVKDNKEFRIMFSKMIVEKLDIDLTEEDLI